MKKIGIIIGIEEYSNSVLPQLNKIEFALNDINSIRKIFTEQFYIEQENLIFLSNEAASREVIAGSLRKILSMLRKEDELYFYYVGHGLNTNSQNRITCWDTDNSDLEGTTLSLNEILLEPIKKSGCLKSFIFIDSSAEEIKSRNKIKALAGNFTNLEYFELLRTSPGHSFFLSCYPGEKSFSTTQTKHGIWAYHLINALNGKDDGAIDSDNAITNASLNKFLSSKIPQYITKAMFINDRQSPYAIFDEALIIPLMKFESEEASEKSSVEIQFQQYTISKEQSIPYKNFQGFNKARHKVPKDHSSFSSKLAVELAQSEFYQIEIEDLFDRARKGLRLKNSNTVKDTEGGALHTEFFRYNITAEQSPHDCTEVLIKRQLELRSALSEFPMLIDDIFQDGFDSIIFPIKGKLDQDSLEDALYDLEDSNQGSFENKDNVFSFFPKNIRGISKVEISQNNLKIIFTSSQTSVTNILDYTQQTLGVMAVTLKNLLS